MNLNLNPFFSSYGKKQKNSLFLILMHLLSADRLLSVIVFEKTVLMVSTIRFFLSWTVMEHLLTAVSLHQPLSLISPKPSTSRQ